MSNANSSSPLSSTSLEGKVALVTGGTTGIGFATAKQLIDAGATVVVTGRNPKTLEHARGELGSRAEVLESDASNPAAVKKLFAKIKEQHGGLDVLFLNAGVAKFAPLAQSDEALFDTTFDVNVKGPWLALKAAESVLNDGASVVLNTSIVNEMGMAGASVYAASKAALRSMGRTLAAEWKERGIRVNAIAPGPIETPIYAKMEMPAEAMAGFQAGMAAQIPLGRFGQPEEVAAAVVFLASPGGSFVNGVELKVDGGFGSM